jgi:hypothetical protein
LKYGNCYDKLPEDEAVGPIGEDEPGFDEVVSRGIKEVVVSDSVLETIALEAETEGAAFYSCLAKNNLRM